MHWNISQSKFKHISTNDWLFCIEKFNVLIVVFLGTAPPPFNIIPAPKSIWYIFEWMKKKFFGRSKTIKKEHMKTIRVSYSYSYNNWTVIGWNEVSNSKLTDTLVSLYCFLILGFENKGQMNFSSHCVT